MLIVPFQCLSCYISIYDVEQHTWWLDTSRKHCAEDFPTHRLIRHPWYITYLPRQHPTAPAEPPPSAFSSSFRLSRLLCYLDHLDHERHTTMVMFRELRALVETLTPAFHH